MATGNEMLVSDHVGEIEVIGNVHENVELIARAWLDGYEIETKS